MKSAFLSLATSLLLFSTVMAESASIESSYDRWNYPFNTSPGSRLSGSTFGAVSNPAFDDHDAQIIVGFDTVSAGVPTADVKVTSLSVLLTTAAADAFEYDPTYDPFVTYLDPTTDADTGRPVELYGVGFRNGFVIPAFGAAVPGPVAFEESEAFAFGNPASESVRNAFMTDGVSLDDRPRDVSDNVADGFDPTPWAVGTIGGLDPGMKVPLNSVMSFEVDLTNPDVAAYVSQGINLGGLFFTVASMHASTQGSQAGIPSFFLSDPNLPDLDLAVAQLSIDYQSVPEPQSVSGLFVGLIGFTLALRRRARVRHRINR